MALRASSGVPGTPDLGATDLRQSLCAGVRGGCGHWEQGYGLMFQSGHLGASLTSPRDAGAEGLSPWADKALQNRGGTAAVLGARPRPGEDELRGGSGTWGDESYFLFFLLWGRGLAR